MLVVAAMSPGVYPSMAAESVLPGWPPRPAVREQVCGHGNGDQKDDEACHDGKERCRGCAL